MNKIIKTELFVFLLLTAISLVGHYYLSWHCSLSAHARYVWKFIWIIGMVVIGYVGLINHEITWIKYIWASLYFLLMIGFGIDKLLLLHYYQSPFFYISSYQFTSPAPFAAACYLPRVVMHQLNKAKNLTE